MESANNKETKRVALLWGETYKYTLFIYLYEYTCMYAFTKYIMEQSLHRQNIPGEYFVKQGVKAKGPGSRRKTPFTPLKHCWNPGKLFLHIDRIVRELNAVTLEHLADRLTGTKRTSQWTKVKSGKEKERKEEKEKRRKQEKEKKERKWEKRSKRTKAKIKVQKSLKKGARCEGADVWHGRKYS